MSGRQQVAIVTAASRGIGLAYAERLARDSWSLVLMSRSDEVHEVAKRLGASAIRGDVTNDRDLARLVGLAISEHGQVDAVVNNTGDPATGDLLDLSDANW